MKFFQKILNAPRRGRRSRKSLPLWQQYREAGEISADVGSYTPEDVEEIDDVDFLKKLYLIYTFTSELPCEKDAFYMMTMSLCVVKKLAKLGIYPPYVVDCSDHS